MHYSSSVFDLEMFRNNHNFHAEASKKVVKDFDFFDEGLLQEMDTYFWAILTDKGN